MLQTLPESDPSVMAYLAEDKKIGDFKTEQSFSNTLAELAYGRTMNTYDLRAALEFRLIDDKTTHDDTATEIEIRTNQPNSIEMESYLNKLGKRESMPLFPWAFVRISALQQSAKTAPTSPSELGWASRIWILPIMKR